jgi:hypothetical protein
MCVSKEVSLGAFILCTIMCLYLFKRNKPNDRWVALFFIYIGCMQYLEYLMWSDQECSGKNQKATEIAFYHNVLQPVVSLIVALYFTNGKLPIYVYIIFILYLLTSLPKIYEKKYPNQCSKPCSKENDGLSWEYTETKNATYVWGVFCLALLLPFMTMKKSGPIYAGLLLATYIIAHFISVSRCKNRIVPPNGSWWCLMASIIPFVAILIH